MNYPSSIHTSWIPHIKHLLEDARLVAINRYIKEEKEKGVIFCPSMGNIFRVFSMPFEEIKVVILGLSPYQRIKDTKRYATGFAFATPGEEWDTPSLEVIRDELFRSVAADITIDVYFDYTLELWHKQGIFLLNKSLLTKLNGDAREFIYENREKKFPGWSWFTKGVIEVLNREKTSLIFCFWGKDAQEYSSLINTDVHHLLQAAHPVAQVYARKKYKEVPDHLKFVGCDHFKKIDEIIFSLNKTKITWIKQTESGKDTPLK